MTVSYNFSNFQVIYAHKHKPVEINTTYVHLLKHPPSLTVIKYTNKCLFTLKFFVKQNWEKFKIFTQIFVLSLIELKRRESAAALVVWLLESQIRVLQAAKKGLELRLGNTIIKELSLRISSCTCSC